MSLQTSQNPVTAAQQSSAPKLLGPQLQGGTIGKIAESVNPFRGEVLLPIELVSLEGRGGLQAKVVLTYGSGGVADQVDRWNVSAPTGIVGLGWSLAFELVLLENQTMSPYDAIYYIASSDGARNRLHLLQQTADEWRFESNSFDFSDIRYFPRQEAWQIRTTDGLIKRYGVDPASRYRAIRWGGELGNWVGSGTQAGQSPFVRAWSLSAMENLWGDSITFSYDSDTVPIGGAAGLTYTRASYLASIADSAGRTIRFRYGDKRYDADVKEYEQPHVNPAPQGPEAHQDRFETRYLESIEVTGPGAAGDERLFTVHLCYSLDRYSAAVGPPAYLYKRYLRGITVAHADGALVPGIRFGYRGDDPDQRDGALGALEAVTYPDGGRVTYTFDRTPLRGSALDLTLTRAQTGGGVPRVWFGDTYAVVTRYDAGRGRTLTVNVYDWNGRWIGSQPLVAHLSGELVAGSLQVLANGDSFVLTLRTRGAATGEALSTWAITRRFGRFGEWDVAALDMPRLLTGAAAAQVVAGRGFVAAVASNVRELYRHVWEPRLRRWQPQHLTLDTAGEYSLAAYDTYAVLCAYDPRSAAALLTIHHLDPRAQAWTDRRLDSVSPILWDSKLPHLSWSATASFATATYLTAQNPAAKTVDYATRSYVWDREFGNVRVERQTYSGIRTDTPEPFFFSQTSGSMVGNAGNLLRYNGSTWTRAFFGPFDQGTEVTRFAYGDDIAIGTMQARSRVMAYDAYSNRFLPMFEIQGSSGPAQPTSSDRYVTVRGRIYRRGPTGALTPIGDLSQGMTMVANHAPDYLAYGTEEGQAFLWRLANGVLAPSAQALSGRLFPSKAGEPGTRLTGARAFATYTGPSFDAAETITLHRLLDGAFAGPIQVFAVTRVRIDDGFGNLAHNAYDYVGDGVTGPYGLGAQFSTVRVVLGSDDPRSAPNGATVKTFFNGMAPAGADDTTPYAELNGRLAAAQILDSAGRLVREERYEYEAVRAIALPAGGQRPLAGSYVRQVRSETADHDPDAPQLGPVTTSFAYTYNEANGEPRTVRTTSVNSEQRVEAIEVHSRFAYEQYPALVDLNLLAPSSQLTSRVDGAIVRISATTWKQDWGIAGSVWAPHRELRARAASAALRDSDWAGMTTPDAAAWRIDRQHDARDRHGNVTAWSHADRVPRAAIYDSAGIAAIATFRNASLHDEQCTYLGFERYEAAAPWTLAGSTDALWAAVVRDDAHTGAQSLRLAGATGGAAGPALAATLALRNAEPRTFVLTSWVKTLDGYTGTPGAAWRVSWGGTTRATAKVAATAGAWQLVHLLVDLPAAATPLAVELALGNADAGALLVDDVRFGPAVGDFTATVYDAARVPRRIATVDHGGATARWLYADDAEPIATVEPGEALTTLRHSGCSRAGNGGEFDPAAPNCITTVRARELGVSQYFDASGRWQHVWTSDPARWQAQGSALRHRAGGADAIAFAGLPPAADRFGIAVRIDAGGAALAEPLGVRLGDGVELTWVPARAAWQLRGAGDLDRELPPRARLYLDAATCAPGLDAGRLAPALRDAFARAAVPLPAGAQVQVVTAGSSWRVRDAASGLTYYLVGTDAPARIAVVSLPLYWLVAATGDDVTLFADGGRVASARVGAAALGAPALFATDPVGFADVVVFAGAQIQAAYQNGAGQTVQEQVSDGDGTVAMQTVFDGVGRVAVTSMGARLPGGDARFAYSDSVASFDWATLALRGEAADQNGDAGPAAYARARFEEAPLGRQVEIGMPGAAFAIAPSGPSPTLKSRFGLNDGAWGLPAGQYLAKHEIAPSGARQITVTDQRGFVVRAGAQIGAEPDALAVTAYRYDGAGNLVELVTPNGTTSSFDHDFLGQRTRTSYAGQGTRRVLRDGAGRVRFEQDDNGAAAVPPYVRYTRYDVLSRVIEEGCVTHAWDDQLAAHADDPAWPSATPSTTYTYDGLERGDLTALGRLVAVTSGQQVGAPGELDGEGFTAIERYDYDARGRTIACTLRADAFRAVDYPVRYHYDNLDGTRAIESPGADGSPGLTVAYRFDEVGRVASVEADGAPLVGYAYDANGRIRTQTLRDGDRTVGVRTFTYNAPGWLTGVSDPALDEQISYTTGRYPDGEGYYDGNPAALTTAARGGQPASTRRHQFDAAGRLAAAELGGEEAVGYSYDADGNATDVGPTRLTYDASGRALKRTSGGQTLAYTYDGNGNETRLRSESGDYDRRLAFDACRGLPLSASLHRSGAVEAALQLRYGHRRRRIFKSSTTAQGTTSTLYLRGIESAVPLVEIGGGGAPAVEYINGPDGLLAMRVNGALYFVSRDRLGSIRAVLDTRGQLVAGYDYQPYGELSGPAFGTDPGVSRYRYAQREWEPVGLYDFRARLYDPVTGRFVSPDPEAQFASAYVYAGNNPTWSRDESGELFGIDDLLVAILIGALVGAAGGAIAGGVAIGTDHLKGGKAAGTFFANLGIGAFVGALGGGLAFGAGLAADAAAAAVTPAFAEAGATIGTTTGARVVAGVVARTVTSVGLNSLAGGVAGGLGGFLDAAHNHEDLLAGFKSGALGGLAGGAAGSVASDLGKAAYYRAAWNNAGHSLAQNAAKGTERFGLGVVKWVRVNSALAFVGGAAGGAAGGALSAKLQGHSGGELLSDVLTGLALGALTGTLSQARDIVKYVRSGSAPRSAAPPAPAPQHGDAMITELQHVLRNREG